MEKGYIILEIGWEYNDETYHTGNHGETYQAPSEVFLDKEVAKKAMAKKNIDEYKGTELASYIDDLDEYLAKGYSAEDVYDYIEKTFEEEVNRDWFQFSVPIDATDKQIEGLMKMLTLRFFTLKTINIK